MPDVNDLRQERQKLHVDMRAMLDEAENGVLSDEQEAQYGAMEAKFDKIGNTISLQEKSDAVERKLIAANPALAEPSVEDSLKRDLNALLNSKDEGLEGNLRVRATLGYNDVFQKYMKASKNTAGRFSNDLQIGTNTDGGFLVPIEFDRELVIALEEYNEIRQWATVLRTSSERKIPLESDDGVAAWIGEGTPYPVSEPRFDQATLDAYKLGRILLITEELMNDSFINMPAYIANLYGRTFGYAEEDAFVNGDGVGKPTGMVQGSTLGHTAAGLAITSDELIDLYHSLKPPYRGRARWMMHDQTIKLVRKLKDGEGQYLWQPGLQAGQPDMLLGRPLAISDKMPQVVAGARSVIFGDMSYYRIGDRVGRSMMRLDERYADTGHVGFRMNQRTDGILPLGEAIKHLVHP